MNELTQEQRDELNTWAREKDETWWDVKPSSVHAAMKRIAALEAENEALRAVVAELVGDESAITDFDPEWEHTSCNFCSKILIRRLPEARAFNDGPHAPDCPVTQARALLDAQDGTP